jgi:acyl carrier protein
MAMTDEEILAGLGEIIDEVAGVPADQVTPDKSFVDDLDIDSLSMVEIAVAAQDKFDVEIPDDQLKNLKTVKDVIDYVRREGVSVLSAAGPASADGTQLRLPAPWRPQVSEPAQIPPRRHLTKGAIHRAGRPSTHRCHWARRDHALGR